jgi:1-acyl-sn-glycerol-3-phosphate acyltransferase
MAAVLRSLLFYLVFYTGTAACALAAVALAAFDRPSLLRCVRAWSQFHRGCTRYLLGISVRIEGELPREGVLLVMKHESFFEAIDLPNILAAPAIFAKVELLRLPVWGRAGRAYGLVPVERDQGAKALRAMLAAARRLVAESRPLALFPEGTRVPHGERVTLGSGFAGLYKLMGLPVVPVAVDSGPLYHRWWKRPGVVTYRVGETVPPGLPRAEAEARVLAAINALNPEPGSPAPTGSA